MKLTLDYLSKRKPAEVNALCFSGAGAVGLAYKGVVEQLEKLNILKQVKTIAGSSAGSIIALAISLGYDAKTLAKIIEDTKWKEFLDNPVIDVNDIIKHPEKLKKHPELAAVLAINLLGQFALCQGDVAREFLKKLITDAGFSDTLTFEQLKKYTGYELIITTCDLGSMAERYISHNNYPKLHVLEAVHASMSIPFVFRPVDVFNRGNRNNVDGGTVDNTPVVALEGKKWLGFICETKETFIAPHYAPIETIFDYIGALVATLRNTMAQRIIENQETLDNIIFIDPVGLGCLDFDMTDEQRRKLIASGEKAVREYFT